MAARLTKNTVAEVRAQKRVYARLRHATARLEGCCSARRAVALRGSALARLAPQGDGIPRQQHFVMPAHSRSKNGVAELVIGPATSGRARWLAYVAGIHVLNYTA
jgi:hypothetical protein